jgi:hypothetical protein
MYLEIRIKKYLITLEALVILSIYNTEVIPQRKHIFFTTANRLTLLKVLGSVYAENSKALTSYVGKMQGVVLL